MPSAELDRLVELGHLHREAPGRGEVEGLIRSGTARLTDARHDDLSPESRFDLAYGAAHALSLAALRLAGYRTAKRYFVFQALPHTLGIPAPKWRLLAKCHEQRNQLEYEGAGDVSETMLEDLLAAAQDLLDATSKISLPQDPDSTEAR